jgi:hypothetical protein
MIFQEMKARVVSHNNHKMILKYKKCRITKLKTRPIKKLSIKKRRINKKNDITSNTDRKILYHLILEE